MDKIRDRADALDVFNRIQIARSNAADAIQQYRRYQVDSDLAEQWLSAYKVAARSEEQLTKLLREWLER